MLTFAEDEKKEMRIGELSEIIDRSVLTIKEWERRGIIPKAKRDSRKWRYYTKEDIEAIKKIAQARVPKYI